MFPVALSAVGGHAVVDDVQELSGAQGLTVPPLDVNVTLSLSGSRPVAVFLKSVAKFPMVMLQEFPPDEQPAP